MLESEQEAKDLKAALDTRINKELFNKEEKNNPKIYWLAAAGLALVIGLTVLFVSNNNDALSTGSNLAISEPEQKAEEKISTDSKVVLKEESVGPIETEINSADEVPAKEIIEKDVPKESNLIESTKGVKTLEDKEGVKSRMIVPASKNETAKDGYFKESEKETKDQTERRDENSAVVTGSNKNTDNDITLNNLDDLAKNDKAKEKINTDYRFAASTTQAAQNKQTVDAEEINDELAVNESKKGKLDEKNKEADLGQSTKQPVVVVNTNSNASGRENGKTKNSRAKKSANKQSSVAGPGDIAYSTSPKTTTQEISGEVLAAVPAEAENKPLATCFYTGGEAAITKDVKEKLKAENLDQKFDATLYINEKKAVEKVEFTNAYELTAKQKEDVIKILKSLNKFNVSSTGKKESFTYKLLYRP